MSPVEEAVEFTMFAVKSAVGGATTFDEILFNFIGPVLGLLQLHGPYNLQGSNFLPALLSTGLLVGYLLLVGRLYRIARYGHSVLNYAKLFAAMLACLLPPFIRLGIQIARVH